jgi:hypothetical protein
MTATEGCSNKQSCSRSGSATRQPGWSNSTTPVASIAPTASSLAIWTLRHGCGTRPAQTRHPQTLSLPDLRFRW